MEKLIWSSRINDTAEAVHSFAVEYDLDADSEEAIIDMIYDINADQLDCERLNLDIKLPNPIIAIANLGLWNGNHLGYKMIQSGNIKDCLKCETDDVEWFVNEKGDLAANMYHHDGTNHVIYRQVRSLDEEQFELFIEKILNEQLSDDDIEKYSTSIGEVVCKVYGW